MGRCRTPAGRSQPGTMSSRSSFSMAETAKPPNWRPAGSRPPAKEFSWILAINWTTSCPD